MTTPNKATIHALQVLRKRVRFENANFHYVPAQVIGSNVSSEDNTLAIRRATRLYVETWVVPILNAIEEGDTRFLKEFCQFDSGRNIEDSRNSEDYVAINPKAWSANDKY